MIRDIHISPVLNGFTVRVGCQTLAYTNINKLVVDLGEYLHNPEETEKRIVDQEGINRRHTLDFPPTNCEPQCATQGAESMANGILGRQAR